MESQDLNFKDNIRDIETDIDQEYLNVTYQFAIKLKNEHGMLRGIEENKLMKQEFENLNKQIEDNKNELSKMFTEEKRLQGVVKSMTKDIEGLRKEVDISKFSLIIRFKKETIRFKIRKSVFMIFEKRIKNSKNLNLSWITKLKNLKNR